MESIDTAALEQLGELIGGDRDALAGLVESFIEEGAEIVDALRGAVPVEDTATLRRGAHSLKSGAQDFGARTLARLAATLESRTAAGWPDAAATEVDEIGRAFEAARTDLVAWLAQQPS